MYFGSKSAILACLAMVGVAGAYERVTHQDMSEQAFLESRVSSYVAQQLQLDVNSDFEGSTSAATKRQRLVNWLREGAWDEDDTLSKTFARYRNHFYNPLDGSGLHGNGLLSLCGGVLPCRPSPAWGLEFQPITDQDYSWEDARQYFFESFTGDTPSAREHGLAGTFYALGHVIHLIQDMAQPQHTRNDAHGPGPLGGTSLYEAYTADARGHGADPLPYGGYDPVYRDADVTTFTEPLDFWHRVGGKGMADYSNRGFVSARTNFRATATSPVLGGVADILSAPGFPHPDNSGAHIEQRPIEDLVPGTTLTGDVDFIVTPITDAYTNTTQTSRTSTYSIFDPDLAAYNLVVTALTNSGATYQTRAVFTLNHFNFESAWPLLIPRAVGYSAGLINYFFRGSFSVEEVNYRAKLYRIVNHTPEPMNGTFQLYGEDAAGTRQPVDVPQTIPVPANGDAPFYFTYSDDPSVSDYVLVFHGRLGDEPDAVVGTKLHVESVPIVYIFGFSAGSAIDFQGDLESYQWDVDCWHEFNYPSCCTILTTGPLTLSGQSGGLAGGGGFISGLVFTVSNMFSSECTLSLSVRDSHGHLGWAFLECALPVGRAVSPGRPHGRRHGDRAHLPHPWGTGEVRASV